MRKRVLMVVAAALLAVALTACGGGGGAAKGPTTREITVHGSDGFAFDPKEIKVNKGDTINLTFVNDGATIHDLTIPDLKVELVAEAGQSKTHTFTVDKAGKLAFHCAQPGHKDSGMTGALVVE